MKIYRWLTVLTCLYLGLATLAFSFVAALQQSKTHSLLIRERLAITAQGASQPFETVISLGLPVTMLRNRAEVLSQAYAIDPAIHEVVLFNPSGIIVEQIGAVAHNAVPDSVLKALRRSDAPNWTLETADHLIAGHSIFGARGQLVGAIYVSYPTTELSDLSRGFRWRMFWTSLMATVLGGLLAWITFKTFLKSRTQDVLAETEEALQKAEQLLSQSRVAARPVRPVGHHIEVEPDNAQIRDIRHCISVVFACLTVLSLAQLAWVAQTGVSQTLTPEIEKRAALVAHTVTEQVARAIERGVPVDQIVGLEHALVQLQSRFPEVASISLSINGNAVVAGEQSGHPFRDTVQLSHDTQGVVSISSDPATLTRQFRSVFLDVSIIVIFTGLLALEIASILLSKTFVGPIAGMAFLARSVLDARRDLVFTPKWPIKLRRRAQAMTAAICAEAAQKGVRVRRLRLTSLADVRLGLFLFAVADEAPLSFFALYLRELPNTQDMLAPELAISLPFAGYLLAALICAPLARPLGQKIGYRRLFVGAALLTAVAKLGLLSAPNILVATLWQSLNGALFIFAMLACQDYLLDLLPAKQRVRSMAIFRAVLFSGVFAGTAIGGILADRFGEPQVFLFCAVLASAAAMLIWIQMAPLKARIGGADEDQRLSLRFLKCFGDWRFALFAIGVIAPQAIIDHVFISYLLALLMSEAGASITMIAQVMLLFFLALTLAGHFAGQLATFSTAPYLTAGIATMVAGAVIWLAGASSSFSGLLIIAIISGGALGLSAGPITAIAVDLAQTRLKHLGLVNVLGMVRVLERGGAAAAMISAGVFAATIGFERTTSLIGLYAFCAAAVFVVTHLVVLLTGERLRKWGAK